MKLEEKFNRRDAKLLQSGWYLNHGPQYAARIKVSFHSMEPDDRASLALHLNVNEALELAESLIQAARKEMVK